MAICLLYQLGCTCGLGVASKHIKYIHVAADNRLGIIQCKLNNRFSVRTTYNITSKSVTQFTLHSLLVCSYPGGMTRDITSDSPGDLFEIGS